MLGVGFIAASAAGGRFTPVKPTLLYAGSGTSDNGKFTITNYDATYIYTVTGSGSVSGSTLTITNANASVTLTAKAPKGLTNSAGVVAERKAPTQTFIVTTPFQCYYSPSCASQCGGCGTFYAQDQWNPNDGSPAGYYSCCALGYNVYDNYSGQGYTWGGSDYTNGQGEWWKIT